MSEPTPVGKRVYKVADGLELFIFETRWMLAPIYIGLVVAELVYSYRFFTTLFEMITHMFSMDENETLIMLLSLVDFAMVANLVMMIVIGSYHLFIRELSPRIDGRPQWLHHVDSSTLKIKMGKSLIGVTSINLLKTFLAAQSTDWSTLSKQVTIVLVFVVSTMAIAWMAKQHSTPAGNGHDASHRPSGVSLDPHSSASATHSLVGDDNHGGHRSTAPSVHRPDMA